MTDPQFVVGGPRIPSEIIRALEEERLVFFCGAGVSIGTDLPNFGDLTLEAIQRIDRARGGIPVDPAIRDAYCLGLYDKALDILEDKEGRRGDLRRFVAKRLTRRLRNANEQLRMHRALLDLAKVSPSHQAERGYRLVTTNYDNRFEKAGLPRRWIEAAPRLGRPQANRVAYCTFLHGRIETERDKRDPGYTSLVLTSADFGDAYLRDGYAARFVLELFREFTVLFIGYSLNDPVMRYLMDIFATENDESAQGQFRPAYAFVAHGDGNAEHQRQLWQAKHVRPILYRDVDGHQMLISTLESWARVHRAASDGRFQIFMDVVGTPFQGALDAGNLDNAAWALSDKGYKTARRLGSLDTEANGSDAHISWFGPLLESTVFDSRDDRRPLQQCRIVDIDETAFQLFRWAMRNLESMDLVNWAISNERILTAKVCERFFDLLVQRLHGSDKSVQRPFMLFWELLIDIAGSHNEVRAWDTFWRIKPGPKPPIDVLQRIVGRLQARLRWPAPPFGARLEPGGTPERLNDLASYRLSDSVDGRDHHRYRDVLSVSAGANSKSGQELWKLTDDLTNVLVGTCRLGLIVNAHFAVGFSRHVRESIAPDARNGLEHGGWEWLIEALVRSFETACSERPEVALAVAYRWRMLWQVEHQSLFGRLYLHAATRLQELPADEAIQVCLDRGDVLWGHEYVPEFLGLLRTRSLQISRERLNALVEELVAEPSRDEDDSPKIDHQRRQRLAKLLQAGVDLEGRARALADEYLTEYPPSDDPREDEVRYRAFEWNWVGPPSTKELIGKSIDEIIELVDHGRDEHGFAHDQWDKAKQVVEWLRTEASRVAETFEALATRHGAPAGFVDGLFWALRDITNQPEVIEQVDGAAATLQTDPSIIDAAFDSCSAWIKTLAAGDLSDETFWRLWDLVRARAPADEVVAEEDRSLNAAINSGGGYLAEGVLDRFWKCHPKVGQGLPPHLSERLSELVSGTSRLAVHARLVCMPALHALYAVDPDWTRQHLLHRLDWNDEKVRTEVSSLWSTHLDYGRWSLDLMAAYKDNFWITLRKSDPLGEHAYRNACWWFATFAIERPGFLSDAEIKDRFHDMGPEGAEYVLGLFESRLRQSDNPQSQWREMLGPWLRTHWPRLEQFRTEAVRTAAAEMLLETEGGFADALHTLEYLHLVGVIRQDRLVLFRLAEAENGRAGQDGGRRFAYASSFPHEVCHWLDRILLPNVPGYEHPYLNTIIEAVQHRLGGGVPECLVRLRERVW